MLGQRLRLRQACCKMQPMNSTNVRCAAARGARFRQAGRQTYVAGASTITTHMPVSHLKSEKPTPLELTGRGAAASGVAVTCEMHVTMNLRQHLSTSLAPEHPVRQLRLKHSSVGRAQGRAGYARTCCCRCCMAAAT